MQYLELLLIVFNLCALGLQKPILGQSADKVLINKLMLGILQGLKPRLVHSLGLDRWQGFPLLLLREAANPSPMLDHGSPALESQAENHQAP